LVRSKLRINFFHCVYVYLQRKIYVVLNNQIQTMRKGFVIFLFAIFLASCEGPYIFNRTITQKDGTKMLLGGVGRTAFEKEPFSTWFSKEYDSYQVNQETVKEIKRKLKRYRIEIFMGSWCEDSQREYPRLMKILDEAKFPEARMVTYAVNESKKSFYGEEEGKDIRFVPTIIFYRGGQEVGRIVESPVSGSLEEDILMIVNETPNTPHYSED